ncbi:GNAT family N-acetyltransferase [Gordonia neofelifaecis]|uniref:N-acetyltransferase domain-containing protein n=1 Tax=Gordonia neofelifaecis NRRL B-59395 TaxID=644548 RepID=F1YHR5_9ACTN|nr:GNAT family N-acetyltransferase [Gordonia neofelifaecis]EGD55903.1 hypothetical protein SCNU_06665 [Gordonia neofelifaecis NRRL B-59395]
MTYLVRASVLSDLDAGTLHELLKLRVDVFVVEQECAYPEIDGRDTESTTLHFWCEDEEGTPVATLRVLRDVAADGTYELRIGRVCVRADHRGTGAASELIDRAVAYIGRDSSVMDAQSHLVGMYAKWGYLPAGAEFVEDGIPHTPLRRNEGRSER